MIDASQPYPLDARERDRWIVARRGAKAVVDPYTPYAYIWEEEPSTGGRLLSTATLFLTNRECPFRCLECDLWTHTLDAEVPVGAIPAQIDYALERLAPAVQIKLYNAGNFFDRHAIPFEDHEAIARRVGDFERVVVESHPSLVGDDCIRFAKTIDGVLEVAMGLETVHAGALEALNKRMTLDAFRNASTRLTEAGIALRAFVLLAPPFVPRDEAVEWACRSIEEAFDCGATVCSVIATRAGNGALDALEMQGMWARPSLAMLEDTLERGLGLGRGIVLADTWGLDWLLDCPCATARVRRIEAMNRGQRVVRPVDCGLCGTTR